MKWFILALVITNNATIPTVKDYAFTSEAQCVDYVMRHQHTLMAQLHEHYNDMLTGTISCVDNTVIEAIKAVDQQQKQGRSI